MPLILPGNVASATAPTTYSVANSVRFNRADSPTLLKAFGTPTNQDKWTFSIWCKRSGLGTTQNLCACQSSGTKLTSLRFDSDNTLNFYDYNSGYNGRIATNRVFRDVAAWYHIVIVWDSGNATAGNRMRMYVNGIEETSFGTDTNPDQNLDSDMNTSGENLDIGHAADGNYFDGYLAEAVFCDGQTYAASDFGEFDETTPSIWKPKDVSGLTFGTNGCYLDFEASDNLGNDANGGTDLTEGNLAAADQATDSPTNNFATFNSAIRLGGNSTLSEGNCVNYMDAAGYESVWSTIMVTKGKWYCEFKFIAGSHQYTAILGENLVNDYYENVVGGVPNVAYNHAGNKQIDGAQSSYGDTYTTGDIIGVALDYTNNFIYFSKNGTFQNSGDPTSGATGTGGLALPSTTHAYAFGVSKYADQGSVGVNFGGCPGFAISSGNADGDGYGNFEYAVPSGYFALCTKNLAEYG